MKKIASLFLSLAMIITILPTFAVTAYADSYSGKVGKKGHWELNTSTGVLNIYSANSITMEDFAEDSRPAWYSSREDIRRVVISTNVKNIGAYAFADCTRLEEVCLSASTTSIGDSAFSNCGELWCVKYASTQSDYDAITVADGNDRLLHTLVYCGTGFAGDYIEWEYADDAIYVTGSGETYDFGNFDPSWKIYDASVKSLVVASGVTLINSFAFSEMTALQSVILPNSVTALGESTFDSTSIKDFCFPANLTFVGPACFNNVSGDDVVITYGGTEQMWSDVSISEGSEAFFGTADVRYCQGKCGDSIDWVLGEGGELKLTGEGYMEDYLTDIYAPWYNIREQIVYANIGKGISYVGSCSFGDCDNLMCIALPTTVTSVSDSAFGDLPALREYIIPTGNPSFVNNIKAIITVGNNSTLIKYPQGSAEASYDIPQGVARINYRAFADAKALTSVNIPFTVEYIGGDAFDGCDALATVDFAGCSTKWESISNIDSNAKLNDIDIVTNDHIYDDGDLLVTPSCTHSGRLVKHCYFCRDTQEIILDPDEHTLVTDKAVTATTSRDGKTAGTHCELCGNVIQPQQFVARIGTVTLSTTKYTYNGKAKKPTVTVKDSKGKKLVNGTDYSVKYTNNTKVGKASVKVTFKGKYSGSKMLTFKINPKSTTISKLTAAKKGFTVKWNKQATQTTGYQVQIATNSKFTNGQKTYTISKAGTTSKKITGLKAKKKYYVRIRTYRTVNGTKYYSAWSKAKTVTTKK